MFRSNRLVILDGEKEKYREKNPISLFIETERVTRVILEINLKISNKPEISHQKCQSSPRKFEHRNRKQINNVYIVNAQTNWMESFYLSFV